MFNLLFLSDGSASFPASVLEQLRQDRTVWEKVQIETLGFGQQTSNFETLERIASFFNQDGQEKGAFEKVSSKALLEERLRAAAEGVRTAIEALDYNYFCQA